MKVTKVFSVDVCRDGGSYSLSFESNDNQWYELFVQIKALESRQYLAPAIYKGGKNSGQHIQTLTWDKAKLFLESVKYHSARFNELKQIVASNVTK